VAAVLGELREQWHATPSREPPDPGVAAIVLPHSYYVPGCRRRDVLADDLSLETLRRQAGRAEEL
jgi:hypothetical protein